MAVFTYKATDEQAAELAGTIAADTPRQARDLLRERGLVIRDIRTYQAPSQNRSRPWRRVGHRHQVTEFIRELSTLLGAGVAVIDSLETNARQHKGRVWFTLNLLRRPGFARGQAGPAH